MLSTRNGGLELLELIKLSSLKEESAGSKDIGVGLIDGPVDTSHPALREPASRQSRPIWVLPVNRRKVLPAFTARLSQGCLRGGKVHRR